MSSKIKNKKSRSPKPSLNLKHK
uniref:Uncharacterized protein n=1 Tax=Rhizophora mucronata TaxID=61149 RepID=A0A2P2PYZ8_RHIMU